MPTASSIPIDTPGLKLYSRRPFADERMNSFDYPLTSRFDESDSLCIFDNVFVPWENVYIYRNLQICADQWWKTPAHLYGNHQAQCRYAVKLRFMLGLAQRMNEMTGNDANPAVQVEMGELASIVSIVENMLLSHEADGADRRRRRAVAVADRRSIQSWRCNPSSTGACWRRSANSPAPP